MEFVLTVSISSVRRAGSTLVVSGITTLEVAMAVMAVELAVRWTSMVIS